MDELKTQPVLPELIKDDPRIGRLVQTYKGDTGRIEHILRYPDGFEHFCIINEQGHGHSGLECNDIVYLEE